MKNYQTLKSSLIKNWTAADILWNEPRILTTNEVFPVDITEDETGIHMRAELPGVSKEDLSVEIHDNVLIIKAEKKDNHIHETTFICQSESVFGSMKRSFTLKRLFNKSDVNASYKNGILTIVLKKQLESFKKINIS